MRGMIDALRNYVETHPNANDLATAYHSIVGTYPEMHRPAGFGAFVQRRTLDRINTVMTEFRERFPDNRLQRQAEYVLLEAEWDVCVTEHVVPGTRRFEVSDETKVSFRNRLIALADKTRGEWTEGMALIRALEYFYLDFWATCSSGSCRREIPVVKSLIDKYGHRGVEVLGIALDDKKTMSKDAFREWCKEHDVTWPQIYCKKGRKSKLARNFHISHLPTMFFIDRNGRAGEAGPVECAGHWIRKELGLPELHDAANGK